MEATQTLGPGEEAMENNGEMPSASAADVTVLPLIPISRFFYCYPLRCLPFSCPYYMYGDENLVYLVYK